MGYSAKEMQAWFSILILCGIVLGGMGSIRGVLVGTAILIALQEGLRDKVAGVPIPPEARFLVYGLLLIAFMRFRPRGFLPPMRRGRPLTEPEMATLRTQGDSLFTLGASETSTRRGALADAPDQDSATPGGPTS